MKFESLYRKSQGEVGSLETASFLYYSITKRDRVLASGALCMPHCLIESSKATAYFCGWGISSEMCTSEKKQSALKRSSPKLRAKRCHTTRISAKYIWYLFLGDKTIGNPIFELFTLSWTPKTQYSQLCQFSLVLPKCPGHCLTLRVKSRRSLILP